MSRSTEKRDSAKSRGGPGGLPKGWSARRKAEVVLRQLRSEVSREVRVGAAGARVLCAATNSLYVITLRTDWDVSTLRGSPKHRGPVVVRAHGTKKPVDLYPPISTMQPFMPAQRQRFSPARVRKIMNVAATCAVTVPPYGRGGPQEPARPGVSGPWTGIRRRGGGRYCVQSTSPGPLGVTAPTVGGVADP